MNKTIIKLMVLLTLISSVSLSSQIRIKVVGDVMPGSYTPFPRFPQDSGKEIIDSIGNYVKGADISIGNFEGAFVKMGSTTDKCSEKSRKENKCFEFGVPEHLAYMFKKIGFTAMTFDNNHCNDYGSDGYLNTLYTFDDLDIPLAHQRTPTSLMIKNNNIAVIAFGFDNNSYKIQNLDEVKSTISDLKSKFDLVIVSFHGGAEGKKALYIKDSTEIFYGENRGNLIKFARTAVDAGADFVFGHGPHVLRSLEIYKNKLIAYSMGNFLTYGHFNLSDVNGITAILDVTVDEKSGDFLSGKIIPFKQKKPGIPYFDINNGAIELIKKLCLSHQDSNVSIDDVGNIMPIKH